MIFFAIGIPRPERQSPDEKGDTIQLPVDIVKVADRLNRRKMQISYEKSRRDNCYQIISLTFGHRTALALIQSPLRYILHSSAMNVSVSPAARTYFTKS